MEAATCFQRLRPCAVACSSSNKQRSSPLALWQRPSRRHRQILCTAQPRQTRGLAVQLEGGSGEGGSRGTSTAVVSEAEVSKADAASAQGLAESLLAEQLVVVGAASSSSGVLISVGPSLGDASSLAATAAQPGLASSIPEGLPSPQAVDAGLSTGLTHSMEDDVLPAEAAAARNTAKARAVLRKHKPVALPWFPPVEFSALVGLCISLVISGLSSAFLCKPVMLSHCLVGQGRHRVMKECTSCCASPAAQANHLVLMQRQPHRVLQPLPLPLRQYLEVDQLPAPTYKVPSLVSLPGRTESGLTAGLVAAKEWLHSRIAYQLQQLASANVSTKVLALWLLSAPFIVLAATWYQKAAQVSFKEAMYKVYALLMRVPGVGINKENNAASYLVANSVFLVGIFSFAAILGIVSDEIKTGIKQSRAGNYNMRLDGHIVLLNWNSSSTALLRHIASAYAEGGMFNNGAPWPWNNRPPVVVLADKPKVDMDLAVHEMLKDRGLKLEVHTRQGNPFKMSDLRKVAAHRASTVIVLHPEGSSSEAIKVSVAMSLTSLGATGNQRVVVQGPSAGTSTVLSSLEATTRQAGGHSSIQAFELPDSQLTHRLVAQTAAQPGILTCWLDLLSLTSNSAEFYCAPIPDALKDKPFVEMRRAFLHAVLCGFSTPEGAVHVNPAETDVPPAGSRLILLGRGGAPHLMATPGGTTLYDSAATAAAERLKKERTYRSKARNILVTNWPMSGVHQLMESFSLFTPSGSTITFVLPEEPPATWPSRIGSCKFLFQTAPDNPTGVKVLLDAGIKNADAVVLGSGPPVGAELEADARILAAVLQVQDAVMASKRRDAPHLVAPIRRYATSKLASQFLDVLAAERPPAAPAAAAAGPPGWLPGVQQAAAVVAAQGAAGQPAGGIQPAGASSTSTAPSPSAAATSSSPADSSSSSSSNSSSGSGGGSSSSNGSSSSSSSSSNGSTTAAAFSSKGSSGLLSSAFKAVGMLPAASASSSPAQQQQQPRPPVIVEPEFLVPTDVASALMTQVVSEPAYSDIMRSLMLCNEGEMELYLRNPASFNIPTGACVSFAEVQEAVRLTGQTAIGYIRGSGTGEGAKSSKERQRRQAVLGCSASHRVTFEPADRIVAIALEYNV